VLPAAVMPLAEDTPLMRSSGEWVLASAPPASRRCRWRSIARRDSALGLTQEAQHPTPGQLARFRSRGKASGLRASPNVHKIVSTRILTGRAVPTAE